VHAGDAGGAADAGDDAADDVAVQRVPVISDQALVVADAIEVGCGPGGKQPHELGVQRDVAVVAELAERDAQPVPGADLGDRVSFQACEFAGPHAGAGQQLDHQLVAGVGAGRAAAISLAASRSSRNLGSGSGFFGMSPAMTGLRGGASGQSHLMIRSKNARTVRIRCRRVSAVIAWPLARGWAVSPTL
jgi:hypothetical protein